jgi:outer membrane protein
MKKMKFALLGLACMSSVAFADDFKLGYINVDRVFTEAKPAKAIQQALKDKYGPQQKQLETMNNNIIAEQQQMQQIALK